MLLIVVILGLILGAAAGRDGGALFGAAIAWLLWQQRGLTRRIAELEARDRTATPPAAAEATPAVAATPATAAAPADPARSTEPAQAPTPAAALAASTVAQRASTAAMAAPLDADQPAEPAARDSASTPAAPPPPLPAAPPPAQPSWLHRLIFGGNTIVKAGVAIFFLGLAFFARWATENLHVPAEIRLAGIGAAALVLLGVGWRLRNSRRGYAMVMQGGGIAVLYLTLFAAFKFYGLIAMIPAFALMAAVAAASAALAVMQNTLSLAFVGALGGFATPLLLSSGGGNHVALFSYYLLLDLGVAAIAWARNWRVLNGLAFLFTYGVGTAWGLSSYRPEHAGSAQVFLIVFFLLFNAVALLPARHAAAEDPRLRWLNPGLLFGLPTLTFMLQRGLVQGDDMRTAFSALLMGAFYVGLAAWSRKRVALQAAFEPVLSIGAVLLTLVIPFAFDAQVTAGAWAVEGAGLLWAGLRQQHGRTRAAGYALLLLAGVAVFYAHGSRPLSADTWLNATLANALLIAAGSLAAAWFISRQPEAVGRYEARAPGLLVAWATLWLLGGTAYEIDHFVPMDHSPAATVAALSAIAALYAGLTHRLAWPLPARPVAAHMPLMLLCLAWTAVAQDAPLLWGGWWAWPLAFGAQAAALAWAAPHWPARVRTAVHALGVWCLAGLGALQLSDATRDWGDPASAWPWLGWLAAPAALMALLLWALRRPAAAQPWPLRAEPGAYRGLAGGGLAAGLLIWAFIANVASNGAARPLPHLPLLNPLDLGIGLACLGAWAWWRDAGAAGQSPRQSRAVMWALGAAAFAWANGMLIRAFHHYGDVPYRVDAWIESRPVQTGLALMWALMALALMWAGARKSQRGPWTVGAALLAAVVVKLMLFDLSGSGSVMRIVSFIGVGVLMLVIGFVAPPPKAADAGAARGEGSP